MFSAEKGRRFGGPRGWPAEAQDGLAARTWVFSESWMDLNHRAAFEALLVHWAGAKRGFGWRGPHRAASDFAQAPRSPLVAQAVASLAVARAAAYAPRFPFAAPGDNRHRARPGIFIGLDRFPAAPNCVP